MLVCDSHIHFYDSAYPTWTGASLSHSTLAPADYAAVQAVNGATRFVVVQPSTYGLDNRVLVNALRAASGAARGIAVVAPDAPGETLDALQGNGVVGLRANLTLGPTTVADLPALADLARPRGWHVQLNLSGEQLVRHIDALETLTVPLVIDHCGYLCRDPALASVVRATLVRFLQAPGRWLKLSAPYVASLDTSTGLCRPWVGSRRSRARVPGTTGLRKRLAARHRGRVTR